MADERVVSDIVTKFFLNTCQLCPRLTRHGVQATRHCAEIATQHKDDDAEADIIPLTTGSVAEFYIEPMLPLVGDIDVMFHLSTELAIPRGHPPPTQLPAEFSNYVKVHEIVDSHLPGYVYLEIRYFLTECTDDDNYNYFESEHGLYFTNLIDNDDIGIQAIHGPALLTDLSHIYLLSMDSVPCMRCLSWPPPAADWPTRHRYHDWPDSATVNHVINNGCDVVRAVHRQCRQDEWMSKHQWRLSFSRAEIVLLNSWMPIQQIVYHMLRVFVKSELLANNDTSDAALSNYSIKTLMMWACELKSSSFWTDDLNVIRICVELLHTLSVGLTDARCPHYFVTSCNLIHNFSDVQRIASQLMSIDKAWLSTWFVNNYIQKCSLLCPESVSSLFNNVSTKMKLQNAVSAVVNWRQNTALKDTWNALQIAEAFISHQPFKFSLTVRSCVYWMTELAKTHTHLAAYFTAAVFLHVAHEIPKTGFTDVLMDVLATVAGQSNSELSLSKATKLIKFVVNSLHSTIKFKTIKVSSSTDLNTSELVELLQQSAVQHLTTYRQFQARDFGPIAMIITKDFEALYVYKHGNYQQCLQTSTQNVCTLLNQYALKITHVLTRGGFMQLLDDDIVSLIALTLIVDPECRDMHRYVLISQATLSLYLMTQCQLKLRHSVTSLAQTLHYIEVAQRRHPAGRALDHLTLKLTKHKALTYITEMMLLAFNSL